MELQLQSYLLENNVGELSYKIEITYRDFYSCSDFICIIDLDYYNYPHFRNAMMDLACLDTTLETKMVVIEFIMSWLESIEVITPCILSEIMDDEEVSNEFKFYILLVDFALQSSTDQFAPLSIFKEPIHFRKFLKKIPMNFN